MLRHLNPGDRRFFIGGSDARIIMGSDEAALLHQVASDPGEAVALMIAVKGGPQNESEPAIGMRGSTARSVLHAQIHHAAQMQAEQMEVGVIRRGVEDREQAHGGLQIRVCHRRQVDQPLAFP